MSTPEPPSNTPPDGLRGLNAKGWMPRLSPLKRMFPGEGYLFWLYRSFSAFRDLSLKQYTVSSPSQIVLGRGYFLRIRYLSTAPRGLPRAFSASVYRALYHRSCRKVWLDGLKLWFSKILYSSWYRAWWKATRAWAFRMLSLPRSRSLCGRDHRNLASRSTLPPCCKASQTHATCSGEKAREEAALTNSSVRTASVLGVVRSMDNSAASSATNLMHSRLSTSFTFSLLMSFAVVTSPAEEEDIFWFKPSLVKLTLDHGIYGSPV
ncbi:hypothetical protein INR49_030772 [Caranx melampygus]|nr:hypothetical protein INR49_030772 [Caranx melampygus]